MASKAQDSGNGAPAPVDEFSFDWVARHLPGAIYRCVADSELTMLALTDRFEQLTGHAVAALICNAKYAYASLIHEDDRKAVLASVRWVVEHDSPCEFESRLRADDERELWVRQTAWPAAARSPEGRPVVEGFIFDISDIRRIQREELERQLAHTRRQRCLFELATHPAIAEGELEQLSKVATEQVADLVELERVSVWLLDDSGEHLELVDLFTRSDRLHTNAVSLSAGDYPAYFDALRSGRSVDAHDAVHDSRTFEFTENYLRPLGIGAMLDAAIRIGGKVAGVLCLEHVGAARTWQKHEINFAGEVADQLSLALLNRARIAVQAEQEELRAQLFHSQKMDALGRLAGGVAHDFNNVLMAISGNAELLALAEKDPLLHRSAQEIVDASFRAGELVSQLLRFARREPLDLRSLDLGQAVRELEGMLRRLLGKRLHFEVRVTSEPVPVRASETLLQQVLTNLVVNARDAVDEDGRITVDVDVVDGVEADEHSRPHARLRVSDNGSGMSPEVRGKVFEPFFTTKQPGEGTGLGLATVYSIMQRLGGSVELDSEPGRGTTVTLLLPLAPEAASP